MLENANSYLSVSDRQENRKTAIKIWVSASLITGLWVLAIVMAPVFRFENFDVAANTLYGFYGYICHQMPSRSFFLFGNQFAVCSRCFGVYFGLFTGFLFCPLFRDISDISPLNRIWLFAACVPMLIDWSLTAFGIWENTFLTRFLTGLLLGVVCSIFLMPALVEIFELSIFQNRKIAKNQ
ncbi:MAG: DUF2085 domain-containing protein [Pyrinomonadaceae bacterium]